MNRREFIGLIGASTVVGAAAPAFARFDYKLDKPFVASEPCLQAPAETTMGVSWKVNGLAKGEVEVADNPEMTNAKVYKSSALGLCRIDMDAMQVRLTGLKPATKYYYRTITTPFKSYHNAYTASLGEKVVGKVHSFTTMGKGLKGHFCVMNDTHAQWDGFGKIVAKIKEIAPEAIVWNGDATNTTQEKSEAMQIFLDPPIADKDYAAEIPVFFESGNHDYRGNWASHREEVVLPRDPAERESADWELKWNFATRLGDIAMIGLDTGEDKPDGHPAWWGLANYSAYREAQAKWLAGALKRPEIAKAKYKIVFCHIPLYAKKGTGDYPNDGMKIDLHGYAYWSRECMNLWAPLFEKHGVQVVIAAHRHGFRIDEPSEGRSWHQMVGGGPGKETVIEGAIEGGKLVVRCHDVRGNKVLGEIRV